MNPRGAANRLFLGAAMAFFFLPFFTLSCGKSLSVKATGIQLVFGGKVPPIDAFTGEGEIKKEPLAGIALALGAVALALSFAGHRGFKALGAASSAASGVALVLLKTKLENLLHESAKANNPAPWANVPVTLTLEVGFWLAVGAFWLGAVISLWENFMTPHESPNHPMHSTVPLRGPASDGER